MKDLEVEEKPFRGQLKHDKTGYGTLRQWRTQVRLGIPAEIPADYENLMIRLL